MCAAQILPKLLVTFLAALAISLPGRSPLAQEPAPPPKADGGQEPEVLLRGPVHEAFAKPYASNPTAGMVVGKKPADPVEEIAPSTRPEGNVTWIPGYWAWDQDRGDFLWVSGVWRQAPPNRRWVPGYWSKVDGGYQWTSGFWAMAAASPMSYLPTPPDNLDEGPASPAPGDDYFWVPGCWRYVDGQYKWQPGYWATYYRDWVWMPCHYVWTPRGCLFVDGYWDYGLYDRGCLFAPVFFHDWHGLYFRPHCAVSLGSLLHFFVHARHCHYFFGDYYGDRCFRLGFQPWFQHHHARHCRDPLFAHFEHRFRRQGIDYAGRLQYWHDHFRDHEDLRPPRTLAALGELRQRDGARLEERHAIVARDLRDLTDGGRDDGRFRQLTREGEDATNRDRSPTRELSDLRRRLEQKGADNWGDRRVGEASKEGDQAQQRLDLSAPRQRITSGDGGEGWGGPDLQSGRSVEQPTEPRIRQGAPETRGFRGDTPRSIQSQIEPSRSFVPQVQRSAPASRQSSPTFRGNSGPSIRSGPPGGGGGGGRSGGGGWGGRSGSGGGRSGGGGGGGQRGRG